MTHTVRFDDMEGDSFVGTVRKAYYEQGEDFKGNQAEFVILELETDFMDDLFKIRMKYSEHKKSLYAHFLKSMEAKAGVRIPAGKDIDTLKGVAFRFERTDIDFGKDIQVKGFPLPVELIEDKKKTVKKSLKEFKEETPKPETEETEEAEEEAPVQKAPVKQSAPKKPKSEDWDD